MKLFDFKLITPEETVYEGKIEEVILPTSTGEIAVLAGHEPLVTILSPGEIRIETGTLCLPMASLGGFAEIGPDFVRVLSDSAIATDKIDAISAENAKKNAEAILEKATDDMEVAEASASLEKALLHIKIANRKRKHH
ncbi:MAG: atpC [Candidatus Berkelbacteria bacterium]|nr:atpC [Candidatus Berkelbacteria bacterium]